MYITGSHSAKRADCASNPGSRFVLRLRLDLKLHGPRRAEQPGSERAALRRGQAQPELQPFVGERKCLGTKPPPKAPLLQGQRGINIEGLALQGGRLVFGFQGPVIDGPAFYTLAVDAKALFEGGDAKPQVTRLVLGAHQGIRDMVAVSDGVLILAGPDDDGDSDGARVGRFHWDGSPSSQIKPEAAGPSGPRGCQKNGACDVQIKPGL